MKLSTLYEARDPKKEAELEPLLATPFYKYGERMRQGQDLADKSLIKHGIPDRQFLPNPDFDIYGSHYSHYQNAQHYDKIKVPTLGRTGPIATKNISQLSNAFKYWIDNFNGERWPALEQAFLNRKWLFSGARNLETHARTSLFKYLNNLNTPWPEGEKMAETVLSGPNAPKYAETPEIQRYLRSRPVIPKFVQQIRSQYPTDFPEGELGFHADDMFGQGPKSWVPQNPWFTDYEAGKPVALPKPVPKPKLTSKQRRRHPSDYPEYLRRTPPFAGWA